jgi:Zn-dependent peptidase ImmA (M78 family)
MEYVERAGIYILWCDFDAPIDGVTMRTPDLPPCIFLNRSVTADRMRFSLAHELAHVIMHRVPTDTMEEEANNFAAELLAPEKELRRDLIGGRITLERLARLKAKWRVSMQFILFQAKAIGCLTDHQSQYLWKQISRLGWRTREPSDTDFLHEEPTNPISADFACAFGGAWIWQRRVL